MNDDKKVKGGWRRIVGLWVSAAAVLAALVALRGPDWIGPATAELIGSWRLSDFSPWNPAAPFAAFSELPYALAGARGWQNAHIVVAWLTLLAWLVALKPRAWQGLAPLVPALVAVLVSTPAAGLSGFGLALLVLSVWHLAAGALRPAPALAGLVIASWLAVWLAPGALPAVAAAVIAWTAARSPRWRLATALLCLLAVHLTPRAAAVWSEAWLFLRWSPQAPLPLAAVPAVLVTLVVLGLAAHASSKDGLWSRVAAPVLLILASAAGQNAYWWAAALWMIPCWPVAREHVQRFGFRIRWWLQTAVLTVTTALILVAARDGLPRWYDLAMTDAVVQPTLTREALPADGPVYINPGGLALARFAGPLPSRPSENEAINLGRESSLWRAADRAVRYRAVWLLGEKSDYAPLARHLGESPDWRLAAADATGLLFLREPRSAEFATEPVQDFSAANMTGGASRSAFLGGTALACLAANAIQEAGELSALAVRRSDLSSRAAAARALVLISLGQPREAVAESEHAISLNPASAEAWQVRAETLLHAGLADDAYAAADRAVQLAPGDAGVLWLAARSANASRALQTEALLLEELIALTAARGGDTAFYHFYLGQSYARQGLARPALRSLQIAAEAPGLTAEQRRELEEEITTLRANPAAL
ncbi:MAG: hypothetical protein WEC73_06120 [Chthoniobacterales bacterium]